MGEWRTCQIGEIVDLIQGLAINAQSKHLILNDDKGLPLLRIKDLLEDNQEIFIDKDNVPVSCIADINDLIFTRTGQVGFVFMGKRGVVHNNCFRIVPKDNRLHLPFLYHYLNRENVRDYLDNISAGSVQSDMTHSIFKTVEIPLPSLHEQRAIASVLSSLDDKIDLLHRQNQTLEAMAEALFRQWFVEEAEEGWEENSLLELIQLVGGGTPKTSILDYWNGDIPWLAGGDIATNHKSFVNNTEKRITEVGLNNSSAKLLPKYATVITARGTVGKYCILAEPMAFSQSNYGILPNIKNCFFFTYLLINHVVEELQSSAYGSVFDTITTTTFKENKVPVPIETEIVQFEKSIYSYFQKMFMNKYQIHTLEKLRDILLPKLMSGEVMVVL